MHLAGLPPLWLGVGVLMSATGTALVASVLAEVYSAVPEEAALTAVLSNAASMVSLTVKADKDFLIQNSNDQFPELAKLLQSELKKRKEKAEKKK